MRGSVASAAINAATSVGSEREDTSPSAATVGENRSDF